MPKKDPDATRTDKAMRAFLLLFYTGRPWSAQRLAKELNCSRSNINSIMDHMVFSQHAQIDTYIDDKDKQRYYQINLTSKPPQVSLSTEDLRLLYICRDLAWNLLPAELHELVKNTIRRSSVLLPDFSSRETVDEDIVVKSENAGVRYDGKFDILSCLLRAVKDHHICNVEYNSIESDHSRSHKLVPCSLVNHNSALYVKGLLLKDSDTTYETTMAVHRISEATYTGDKYTGKLPESNPGFGLMDGEAFRVKAKGSNFASSYINERKWSDDEEKTMQDDGSIIWEFTAKSRPEVISLMLSFGEHVTVIEPEDLRKEMAETAESIINNHQ